MNNNSRNKCYSSQAFWVQDISKSWNSLVRCRFNPSYCVGSWSPVDIPCYVVYLSPMGQIPVGAYTLQYTNLQSLSWSSHMCINSYLRLQRSCDRLFHCTDDATTSNSSPSVLQFHGVYWSTTQYNTHKHSNLETLMAIVWWYRLLPKNVFVLPELRTFLVLFLWSDEPV